MFFDNFTVSIATGNIIEEDHYYPFGLKIAGISSQKLGDAAGQFQTYVHIFRAVAPAVNKTESIISMATKVASTLNAIATKPAGAPASTKPTQEQLDSWQRDYEKANSNPDGTRGILHLPTPYETEEHPVRSGFQSVGYYGLELIGVKRLDVAIATWIAPDVSYASKTEASFDAILALLSGGFMGEGEGGMGEGGEGRVGEGGSIEPPKYTPPKSRPELPSLDATGKVHGELPEIQDLKNYSNEELTQFSKDLERSVKQRIKVTSKEGPNATDLQNRSHGQRQALEQQLIKAIQKYLGQRNQ